MSEVEQQDASDDGGKLSPKKASAHFHDALPTPAQHLFPPPRSPPFPSSPPPPHLDGANDLSADAIKVDMQNLAQSLEAVSLQHQRLTHFDYQPFSLPASRVSFCLIACRFIVPGSTLSFFYSFYRSPECGALFLVFCTPSPHHCA
jgi:hypothetical protein